MSFLSPSRLVLGLFHGVGSQVLAARTARWIFETFPQTFSPTAPTDLTPVEQ